MGEILKAYQTLNKVLNLGLSRDQMLAAEAQFKVDLGITMKFPKELLRDPTAFSADWEVTGILTPRRRKLRSLTTKTLTQLKNDGLKDMQERLVKPTRVTARGVTRKKKR